MNDDPYSDWRWRRFVGSTQRTWQTITGEWWMEKPNTPQRRRRLLLWWPPDALRVLIHWSWARRWF